MFTLLHARSRMLSLLAAAGVLAAGLGAAAPAPGEAVPPAGGKTTRVSVSSTEEQGNEESFFPAISADARYVVFWSWAGNLVADDTNGTIDVFVRDRELGITRRVSVSSSGRQSNERSLEPAISAHGRYVVFTSHASNLVPLDTNGAIDVFARDRTLGITRRVSVSGTEHQANGRSIEPAISSGGRYVAFKSHASSLVPSDTNSLSDVFVRDRKLGTTYRVSVSSTEQQGNGRSRAPVIGAGGRYVAFTSAADNLVPGDTNNSEDVFVRDRKLGTTRRVSVSSTEQQSNQGSLEPAISADGRYVAFSSTADNLVPGDTNGAIDVFVRDRKLGTTRRVSVSNSGQQSNGGGLEPAISAGGRYVAFASSADNLVPGDTNACVDVFIRDRKLGTTRRVSVSNSGHQANGISYQPATSAGGRYVVFRSWAWNLVPGDTNTVGDVFIRDRWATS